MVSFCYVSSLVNLSFVIFGAFLVIPFIVILIFKNVSFVLNGTKRFLSRYWSSLGGMYLGILVLL